MMLSRRELLLSGLLSCLAPWPKLTGVWLSPDWTTFDDHVVCFMTGSPSRLDGMVRRLRLPADRRREWAHERWLLQDSEIRVALSVGAVLCKSDGEFDSLCWRLREEWDRGG